MVASLCRGNAYLIALQRLWIVFTVSASIVQSKRSNWSSRIALKVASFKYVVPYIHEQC